MVVLVAVDGFLLAVGEHACEIYEISPDAWTGGRAAASLDAPAPGPRSAEDRSARWPAVLARAVQAPCTGMTGYAILWVSFVPDDHHVPMLMPEIHMSITEVEAAYTEAAR